MRLIHGTLLAVALVQAGISAPIDTPGPIEFPELPVVVPQPLPPNAQPTLTPGVIYPVVCRTDCVFRAYPAALVTIRKEVVPAGETLRDRGNFIDGTKEKRFKGPCTVYLVECAKGAQGTVELVATPLGLKAEAEIVTKAVMVQDGTAPQPPPEPKPPEPVKSFRVVLIYESGDTLTPQQNSVLFGKAVEDFLTATCTGGKAGWRRRDKDAPGETDPTMAALWAAVKPSITSTPAVAVEVNSKVEIIPIEATPAAMVAKLKAYAGVK